MTGGIGHAGGRLRRQPLAAQGHEADDGFGRAGLTGITMALPLGLVFWLGWNRLGRAWTRNGVLILRAGGAEQMSAGGFGGADAQCAGAIARPAVDCGGFGGVVVRGGRAVGVDVIDLGG